MSTNPTRAVPGPHLAARAGVVPGGSARPNGVNPSGTVTQADPAQVRQVIEALLADTGRLDPPARLASLEQAHELLVAALATVDGTFAAPARRDRV